MQRHISGLTAASLLLFSVGLHAQMSGTAHPEALHDDVEANSAPPQHYVKPSPAVPMPAATATTDDDMTRPLPAAATATETPMLHERAAAPYVAPVETARATPPADTFVVTDDPNSGVVIEVHAAENELPAGTLLNVGLQEEISTESTTRGAVFHARLLVPVERHGRILVPAGSILSGRVSALHSGHHVISAASIHLLPEFLTLPGGATYRLNAQVIDLADMHGKRVNDEGTILGNDHAAGAAAAVGLTTAGGAAAGAIIGGGVGLVVGAGVGAGVGSVVVLRQDTGQTLPKGTRLICSLNSSVFLNPTTH
jgi:hypothetical protein